MGRSAKLHKRVNKTASSTSAAHRASAAKNSVKPAQQHSSSAETAKPADAKRRDKLKAKSTSTKSGPDDQQKQGYVLGGADYVNLMMGSRRKAREEAAKLPK